MSDIDRTSAKMGAMFLPDVENNPQPGPYADALRMMQAAGPNTRRSGICSPSNRVPRIIWRALRKRSCASRLRSSPWIRELIAAFTSARNDCPF